MKLQSTGNQLWKPDNQSELKSNSSYLCIPLLKNTPQLFELSSKKDMLHSLCCSFKIILLESLPNKSDSPSSLSCVGCCRSTYVSEVNTALLMLSLGVFDHLHVSEMTSTNGIHPFYMHVKESERPFECHVHTPISIRCVILPF